MFSLFSSFDFFIYFFNNVYFYVFFFFFFSSCYFFISKVNYFYFMVSSFIYDFFFSICSMKISKSSHLIFCSLFFFFFYHNLISIFPYVFSITSHLCFVLFYSLIVWFSINFFGYIKSFYSMMVHLIPVGTPFSLVFFMFIIEMVSNLIRPITLSVRLMANILSGHLLMVLLSYVVSFISVTGLIGFFFYLFLVSVELLVSLIQSYIFCTLICLYYSELF